MREWENTYNNTKSSFKVLVACGLEHVNKTIAEVTILVVLLSEVKMRHQQDLSDIRYALIIYIYNDHLTVVLNL